MKKTRLLNSELSYEIAKLGHTDHICLCDAGLPIPGTPKRIDLAIEKGVPTFMGTLDVILSEMQVEEVVIAAEMEKVSPQLYRDLMEKLEEKCGKVVIEKISHEGFKSMTKESKAVVRTGECTPYANIILKSGVVF